MIRIEFRHLRYFIAVAEEGSFSNAAERRRIVLVVTSGHFQGVDYQLGYAAVGRHGRLPGWIAF